jgi:hypothetical protein
MPNGFEEQLAFGQEGEHMVAQWLLGRGSAVAPLYQYTKHDKAPVILWDESGRAIHCTLPDLQCYVGGEAFFAEVKRKNQWWENRDLGAFETGTDERLWRRYTRVAQRTGCPVWLFFLHETREPTGLFVGEIQRLNSMGPRHWRGGGKPLVFVQHAWLRKVAEIDELAEVA